MRPVSRTRLWQFGGIALALAVFSFGSVSSAMATDLSGTWTGHWLSHTNGHEGPLKAKFRRINASQYRVRFSGRFLKCIPFCYTQVLDVISDDGQTVEMAGSSDLGCIFGVFHYRASANNCHFQSNYSAEGDQGHFSMTRQTIEPSCWSGTSCTQTCIP